MDDTMHAAKSAEGPLQGPHYVLPRDREPSTPAFFPLKLMLEPSGPVLELTRPDMLMGRHSEADVRLPLPDVSRRHCRFLFIDQVWQVFDLDSLNGVFVNDKRVQHAMLRDHDRLTIGGFHFTVELSDSASGASNSADAEAVIHRIADALPRNSSELNGQRKVS